MAEDQPEKHCWVCFATEQDDLNAEWVSPCKCRGCTKWIHQACLQRWLDEKQKENVRGTSRCPQCNTKYHIVFPKMGPIVCFMERFDTVLSNASPFAAVGVVFGTVYWSAVTYGAVTVMQVVGHKRGMAVMEEADPLFMLMGLPTIPVLLILGKMIRWEEYLLRFWYKYVLRCRTQAGTREYFDVAANRANPGDHLTMSRTLCGALIFPSIATLLGQLLFGHVASSIGRTLLGGVTFVLAKGALKIYFKQQQYVAHTKKHILDYPDDCEDEVTEGEVEALSGND